MAEIAVVVMAYGTPAGPDDVEAYYTHIRRGRPPDADQLADLVGRYDAIGGTSPLAARTAAQCQAIADRLDDREPGRYTVVLGNKHAAPFVEDAVEAVRSDVDRIVGLVLAPHYSAASVGQYHERAREAAGSTPYRAIERWSDEPAHLDFLAAATREAIAEIGGSPKVVFTAHSLPERVLADDPYPDQLHESAAAIAARAGLDRWAGWSLAWQSAGRTPEPWRGPDVLEVIDDLAATGRASAVVVCAQGFVSDHLEVLYDLDIEARARAAAGGLAFARTRSLNADRAVMDALAERVRRAAR